MATVTYRAGVRDDEPVTVALFLTVKVHRCVTKSI